jgi:23S rRNA (uracil1939-C5)-methyltransferase
MARRRRKYKQPEAAELSIDGLSHEGRGLSLREGKRVFIEGGLPGERVNALITSKRTRYEEGKVVEVLVASAQRVKPRCEHAAICGGCSLQHFDSQAQIDYKQTTLMEHLQHFGEQKPEQVLAPVTGPTYGYRRKARLGVRYVTKRDEVLVGFREKGNSFITDISQCHVLDERLGDKIPLLREFIMSLDAYRTLPQIEVAIGDDVVALVFRHMEALSDADLAALTAFAKAQGFHVYLQPGGPETVHKLWPEQGDDRLTYRLDEFDLEMRFHPMDFTQVNAAINIKAVHLAMQYLDPQPGERILDLFCGLGNFTMPLARSGATVIGVEGSEAMVKRGYENAAHNGLDNVDFFAADLTQDFSHQSWSAQGFDKILIDPPRSGALEMVQKIAQFKARRIVYVSCNPATLARDAGELARHGYKLMSAGVMDMFPHTAHVESIAVFEYQ